MILLQLLHQMWVSEVVVQASAVELAHLPESLRHGDTQH